MIDVRRMTAGAVDFTGAETLPIVAWGSVETSLEGTAKHVCAAEADRLGDAVDGTVRGQQTPARLIEAQQLGYAPRRQAEGLHELACQVAGSDARSSRQRRCVNMRFRQIN